MAFDSLPHLLPRAQAWGSGLRQQHPLPQTLVSVSLEQSPQQLRALFLPQELPSQLWLPPPGEEAWVVGGRTALWVAPALGPDRKTSDPEL